MNAIFIAFYLQITVIFFKKGGKILIDKAVRSVNQQYEPLPNIGI